MSGETAALIAGKMSELGITAVPLDKLDDAVLDGIPKKSHVLSIEPSGASAWVQTVRITCSLDDGTVSSYFLKSAPGEEGQRMMRGSFESESTLHQYSPSNVPRPIAWGSYKSDPNMWFYLCAFHEMVDEVPEPKDFVSLIVNIHKTSMGQSPEGRYGFPVTTHLANLPNDNTWSSSWEVWYSQALQRMFSHEEKAHGRNERLEELKKGLFERVIPRLLRPLETGGHSIQPSLIHSDLWPGNCMPDADTGEIMIFDSCGYWGHNEADLGSWRAPRYRMGRLFLNEYQKVMGISEPKEDWDDRNALYALAIDEMQRLVSKYPEGYEGGEERLDFQLAKAQNELAFKRNEESLERGKFSARDPAEVGAGSKDAVQESEKISVTGLVSA